MNNQIKNANGLKFTPGYPICQGCDELAVGNGWFCAFKPKTSKCKYPENMHEVVKKQTSLIEEIK